MTPQFYARYVPPSNSGDTVNKAKDLEDSRSVKKQKKQPNDGTKQIGSAPLEGKDSDVVTSKIKQRKSKHKSAKSDLPFAELGENVKTASSTKEADAKASFSYDPEKGFVEISSHKHISAHQSSSKGKVSDIVGHKSQVQEVSPSGTNKKKKKRKQELDYATHEDLPSGHEAPGARAQASDQTKHVKVLSKYEKSIRAAAKTKDNTSDKTQPKVREVTPPKLHGLIPIPQPAQLPDPARPSALSALPSWLTRPIEASTVDSLKFESLSLNPLTTASLKTRGFDEAFAIQATVLQLLLPGQKQHQGDLCIAASTGSGKTLAYALPMIEALRDKALTRLRGLVVVPTRELVNQAREILELCSNGHGLRVGTAFGSISLKEEQESLISLEQRYDPDAYRQEQMREIDEDEELMNWDEDRLDVSLSADDKLVNYVDDYHSNVDILVCTPGRLVEHLEHTRGFVLDHVQWLVIDEADRLLEDGFQQWVHTVMPALERQNPPNAMESLMMHKFHFLRRREVRKIILSATMTRDVSRLKELNLRRPQLVTLKGDQGSERDNEETDDVMADVGAGDEVRLPSTLHEIAVQIKDEENKPLYLIELLQGLSSIPLQGLKKEPHNVTTETSDDHDCDDKDNKSELSDHDYFPNATSSSGSSSDLDVETDSDISMKDYQARLPSETLHGSLIFAHSTSSAHRLSRLLSLLVPQQALTAAILTKSSRKSSERVLSQLRNGKLDTIITTDRASRGLDIPNLAYVINYDMPSSTNSYIHRVGRTARAGKPGTAITLVGWREGRWFWNEIGRGPGIRRGNKKIARQSLKQAGWNDEERKKYSDALEQLGKETKAERKS
ncbi:MAG: hypothetical protein Q9209_005055 [Squamulea sp. 1 TL-2023]